MELIKIKRWDAIKKLAEYKLAKTKELESYLIFGFIGFDNCDNNILEFYLRDFINEDVKWEIINN